MTQPEINEKNVFDIFYTERDDKWLLFHRHFMNYTTGVAGSYIVGWALINEEIYSPAITLSELTKDNSILHNISCPEPQHGFVLCEISNHRRLRLLKSI